ncbi:MAG: hypothetical protein JSW17_03220 [Candidatus Omnitrophota bacterium]|nr:MAG: hypothetical protein JSW17_03220 [Candidatus Omnitrophota bacterium]
MARRIRTKLTRLLLVFVFVISGFSVYAQEEGMITLIKFKEADIGVVMQSISQKAFRDGDKVNIVVSPNVKGFVNVHLENVSWLTALEAILTPYDYSYEWVGRNIILVDTLEKIKERESKAKERQEVEVPRTRVFKLKYIDANDAKRAIEPLLSPMGRASVLEMTGQSGWEFGTESAAKRARVAERRISRTKTLVVSDNTRKLSEIEDLLRKIDVMPQQILIKARIMEVNRDALTDIGFDWGTGDQGGSQEDLIFTDLVGSGSKVGGGHMLSDQITPAAFNPLEGISNLTTADTGLKLAFRKLTGTEFEVILHALEEDGRANSLSAPVILTLNGQEASILVGQKYPIVKTDTSTETATITGGSLDYYQDIGIQLNVVPQICGENEDFITMIIHPAITTRESDISITNQAGDVFASYPLLNSREAETQVFVKDGETIVMGGLLKDVKRKQEIGVPILRHLPILGWLFKRYTDNTEKIDLLIFITAKIVKPGEPIPLELLQGNELSLEFKEEFER